jgi:hypothetical protein
LDYLGGSYVIDYTIFASLLLAEIMLSYDYDKAKQGDELI